MWRRDAAATVLLVHVLLHGVAPVHQQHVHHRRQGTTAATATKPWALSPLIDELDFETTPDALQQLKRRKSGEGSFGHVPLLVRNAPLGDSRSLAKLVTLAEDVLLEERQANPSALLPQVKLGEHPTFCYWSNEYAKQWLGGVEAPQRQWHNHTTETAPAAELFRRFHAPGAPYAYWSKSLPSTPIKSESHDLRQDVCKMLASDAEEAQCSSWPPAYDDHLWVGSAGATAHAHFDRVENIVIQLQGQKRWTLWAPHQLGDLCLYPSPHPAQRHAQATLGSPDGGDEENCAGARFQHNRSAILGAGDVLLLPAYYAHRVESLTPSIGYSLWWEGDKAKYHNAVQKRLVRNLGTVLNPPTHAALLRSSDSGNAAGGVERAARGRREVSASLRTLLRSAVTAALPSSGTAFEFLRRYWSERYEVLPESESLSMGTAQLDEQRTRRLCQDETSMLPSQLRSSLREQGQDLAQRAILLDAPPIHMVLESLGYVIGECPVWLRLPSPNQRKPYFEPSSSV